MKILSNLSQLNIDEPTAVAIGKFDGVHLGHRALIDKLMSAKATYGYATVIFTFTPSPAEFFGFSDGKQIMTVMEKRAVLEDLGIDYLVEFPFNKETAGTLPEDFVRHMLVGNLHAGYIVAGDDLSFGKKGKGNIETLNKLKEECGYDVVEIGKIKYNGVEISSSEIRRLISINDLDTAGEMIGAPYSIRGTIVSGNRIGRTIGFPTINILIDEKKVLPHFGVYFSKVKIEGKTYNGISNIGVKPTIKGNNAVAIETYIYDFNEVVYDKEATVSLIGFRRKETKFDGIEALKAQLDADIEAGRIHFGIN